MSNAQEEMELDELKAQIDKQAEEQKQAATEVKEPSPEPVSKPIETKEESEPVTHIESEPQSKVEEKDNPMEWAKKKGFKSPEDMARALLQKEQEFHQSRQTKEEKPPQTWQPAPVVPQYPQYQPVYQPPMPGIRQIAANYPQIPQEDFERLFPVIIDAATVVANQRTAKLEEKYGQIERSTMRNNELMTLMQDPAFKDERVQKEIHQILDSDPGIFQRERTPFVYAFKEAIFKMGREQLQRVGNGTPRQEGNMPPVTAGGGNGSMIKSPKAFTEKDFESWTAKEMESYMKSNGRNIPKRYL